MHQETNDMTSTSEQQAVSEADHSNNDSVELATRQDKHASDKTLFMYATTVSDVGTVRSNNQDSSFAGEHLAAICDGMGGHAGGDTASTIAIRSLAHIEQDSLPNNVKTVSSMMETSIMAAHDAIVGKAKRERQLAGMGTTVTTIALVYGYWILAHLGDSRAYLLRDNRLIRMTCDHSYVQHLINTGHITAEEARNHPQRNVVMRVLGDFDIDPRPDIALCKAHPSDRWLLCSDGLCGVLEDSTIQEVMRSVSNQEECAQTLVSMALKAGSTDNVTAVIADATLALDVDAFDLPHQIPLVGGAASNDLESIADIVNKAVASAPALREGKKSPAQRAAELTQETHNKQDSYKQTPVTRVAQPSHLRMHANDSSTDTNEIPIVTKKNGRVTTDPHDPEVARAVKREQVEASKAHASHRLWTRVGIISAIMLTIILIAGSAYSVYCWTQRQYYLGQGDDHVVIYQGVPTNVFGFELSHKVETTDIIVSDLDKSWQEQLKEGISLGSLNEARGHAALIRREMRAREIEKSRERERRETNNKNESASKKQEGVTS